MSITNVKKTVWPIILSLVLAGCAGDSENSEESVEENFDFTQMMANYADNIILPIYSDFGEALNTAATAVDAYCVAIDSAQENSSLSAAQSEWRNAMNYWQRAELFIVGPASENSNARRNAILSYASNFPPSSCAVDQSVVLAQGSEFDINTRAFNSRGLDALEYLLFNDDLTHTCPVQIAETQTWNALSESERKRQRCDFAQRVVEDLESAAQSLEDGWAVSGGDFRTSFINPVNLSTNIEALSDAMFYIELETKDTKVGLTTGINDDCNQTACPAATESPYSQTSLENIRENLVGFRLALNGAEGLGFDDIIVDRGFPTVVSEFNTNIDLAIALIDDTNTSLLSQSEALLASGNESDCSNSAANPDAVRTVPICSLHGYLKRITDALRVDFITIVDLDLPDRGQSDND